MSVHYNPLHLRSDHNRSDPLDLHVFFNMDRQKPLPRPFFLRLRSEHLKILYVVQVLGSLIATRSCFSVKSAVRTTVSNDFIETFNRARSASSIYLLVEKDFVDDHALATIRKIRPRGNTSKFWRVVVLANEWLSFLFSLCDTEGIEADSSKAESLS